MKKPFSTVTDLGHQGAASGKTVNKALAARILRVTKSPDPTPSELFELMEVARAQGATSVAEALRARLDQALVRRGSSSGASAAATRASVDPALAPGPTGRQAVQAAARVGQLGDAASPVEGVPDAQWEKFAAVLSKDRPLGAEDRGRLGMYSTSVRRLADLGIVSNPRKERTATGDTWAADWDKISRDAFLASPRAQHQVLRKSMSDYAAAIRETMAPAIGRKFSPADRDVVSLSGLLAVAHVAGLKGLESWLRSAEERKKFPNTTRLFAETNGIF